MLEGTPATRTGEDDYAKGQDLQPPYLTPLSPGEGVPFAKGVEYVEFDISKDGNALDEMIRLSGARSVPVIVGCEDVVVGFDEHRLEAMINCMKNRTDLRLAT